MNPRVLLADDERDILEPVRYALERNGFEVTCLQDGDETIAAARSGSFDVLVCDVMMPGMRGTEICRTLRAESDLPIILLTALDAEVDRVVGLEIGADDYVTKPFSTAELVSRIRALLRRREIDLAATTETTTRRVGGLTMDLVRHSVEVDARRVTLTASEFNLLALLTSDPGRVFSRRQVMEHLWQSPHIGDLRACDVHISNLRRKIERDPARPERILTVREVGYKFSEA